MRRSVEAALFRRSRPLFGAQFDLGTVAAAVGGAVASYSRSTTATIDDWEQVIRTVLSGEARFRGLRRVRNLVATKSEDFSNAAWTKTNANATATTLTASAGNGTAIAASAITSASQLHVLRVQMSRITGSGNIQLTLDNGGTWTTVTLTTTDQIFTISQTLANPQPGVRIVTSADAINVTKIQVEIAGGNSNTNPSEYVSVGVLSAPYHGANVDGVKWFPYQNGNTVSSNVVTEVQGAAIASSTRKGYRAEKATVNRIIQSEDMGTTWAAVGTPTRVAANTRCGDVVLDLIGDDSAAALEGYSNDITWSGDGTKSVTVHVAQGTSTSSVVRMRDETAGADRLLAAITWSGATPVVTMTTGTEEKAPQQLADSVWRIFLVTTAATAANTNRLYAYPATDAALSVGNTGTINMGGWMGEDASSSTSYIKTTTAVVTRNIDALSYATAAGVTTACTLTCEFEQSLANTGVARSGICLDDGTTNNRVTCPQISTAGVMQCVSTVGGVDQAAVGATTLTVNTRYKQAFAAIANDFRASLNGSSYGTPDVSGTFPSGLTTVRIGSRASGGNPFNGDIARASIYPLSLTDSAMNQLTA